MAGEGAKPRQARPSPAAPRQAGEPRRCAVAGGGRESQAQLSPAEPRQAAGSSRRRRKGTRAVGVFEEIMAEKFATLIKEMFKKHSVSQQIDLLQDMHYLNFKDKEKNLREDLTDCYSEQCIEQVHPRTLEASRWYWKNYQYVLAFLFAIEEINKDSFVLPNMSLGFDLYNAFPSNHGTLESTLLLLYGGSPTLPNYNCQKQSKSMVVFAGTESSFSTETGTLLELYKTPQMMWTIDHEYSVQCPAEEYSNTKRNRCVSKVVTFLSFQDTLGVPLACRALCLFLVTAAVLWVFMKHRDTPIVKENNRALSYILLFSLLLCFLCSLLFIGCPNTATCILCQVTFAIVFTVAVSTVLAKTITVFLAFKAMKPGRTMRWLLASRVSNSVIPICTLIQVMICGIWVGTSPPFIDIDTHSEPRSIIIECNKGSVPAFYCVLGYLGSLALGSFSLAFLARNLPDTFSEAKFLMFSMLLFCCVLVTFLPVYHSTKGKVIVAVEIFSILASSAGLLGCIFAPKCYIILIRPDKNSLKQLRGSTVILKVKSGGQGMLTLQTWYSEPKDRVAVTQPVTMTPPMMSGQPVTAGGLPLPGTCLWPPTALPESNFLWTFLIVTLKISEKLEVKIPLFSSE
ncbi:LOW QUALITY PROTEIN: extracellular calcium-sensing receptor-like [Dasypus novemcinctus]|uniref:LOW QUALITY PROTEIN: extracellular calcium-sensing receptor-like n=1 Tax=Dasypus novemcinctus TaxID=9361 RepID=UPI0039C988A5